MNNKLLLAIIASILVIITVVFVGYRLRRGDKPGAEIISDQRQLINVLPIKDRPFVALFPHSSNKLITLYAINKNDSKNIAIEIEYLSGNALKGGRGSIPADATFPYTKAFLLGSCSAGGKCSFDTDITTGTIKTKLEQAGVAHVLRSNYVFAGPTDTAPATSDRKIIIEPTKLKGQLVVGGSHGYIGDLDKEAAMEPVYLAATTGDKITGKLKLVAPDATGFVLFDGETYKPLTATKTDAGWEIVLNHTPQAISTKIVRDDLKGAEEDITLYLLGPIVAVK